MNARKKLLLGDEHLEWFYFYAAPEIANVMGYNAGQGFAYFMLRARCWMNGTLPNDLNKLVRWCNNAVSNDEVQFVLDEHFILTDGFWTCPELDDLREQAMKQRSKLSEAGRKAGIESAARRKSSTTVERPLNDRQPREEEGDGEGEGKGDGKGDGVAGAPTLLEKPSYTQDEMLLVSEFPSESIPPRGRQRLDLIQSLKESDPEKVQRFMLA